MQNIMINEPLEEGEYAKTYTYIVGHGFSAESYKAELIGRFGTTTEAESHLNQINTEILDNNHKGCIAISDEFPFLVLEIITIEFDKNEERSGIPFRFYSFDWKANQYVESKYMDKNDVLNEYKSRAEAFMKELEEEEENND